MDEASYTADMYSRLVQGGFPSSIGMLIDTSRNGWGGGQRPTAASTSTSVETFVTQSKVDHRPHRGAWCNQNGAGIGERPVATPPGFPSSHIDGFVWVKPPGESDGASSDIPNNEGKRFDRMCDPTFAAPALGAGLRMPSRTHRSRVTGFRSSSRSSCRTLSQRSSLEQVLAASVSV